MRHNIAKQHTKSTNRNNIQLHTINFYESKIN